MMYLVLAAAAAASLAFMLTAATPPALLLAMFVIWVVAPFAVLALLVGRPWFASARPLVIAIAAGSVLAYAARAVWPGATRPAFAFLVVPTISLALVAVAVVVTRTGPPPSRGGSRADAD